MANEKNGSRWYEFIVKTVNVSCLHEFVHCISDSVHPISNIAYVGFWVKSLTPTVFVLKQECPVTSSTKSWRRSRPWPLARHSRPLTRLMRPYLELQHGRTVASQQSWEPFPILIMCFGIIPINFCRPIPEGSFGLPSIILRGIGWLHPLDFVGVTLRKACLFSGIAFPLLSFLGL